MPAFAIETLRRRLLAAAPASARFGFQGLRAADAIAVEECLPLEFLIACDWGLDGPRWDARLRFFSAERGSARRIVWTHSSLVEAYDGPLGAEMRAFLRRDGSPRFVVPYRSTEFLARLAAESGGQLAILANPLALKARLDDKVAFREEAQRRGLEVTPGEIIEVRGLEAELFKRWGSPLVVTERIGSSGNQTHLVNGPEALPPLRERLAAKLGGETLVIARAFVAGPAVGATGLVWGGRAWMSHPSVMVTGLEGCAMHRFDYAGSDYGAYLRLPRRAQAGIGASTLKIGEWAAGLGYKGIFGVDFIVHGEEAYALELNPRLLGTTQLLTELELRAGDAPPTVFWHLGGFLGLEAEPNAPQWLPALAKPRLAGFQLLLRNTGPIPLQVGSSLNPGIYGSLGASPRFLREGERLSNLRDPEEVFLTCSPPERGTRVEPRGVLFKLEGLGTLYDEEVQEIAPWVREAVRGFTAQLGLSSPR
ncbi:MAG: ATP-grasp domain-containing protein [Nitrospinota bacterium]